MPAISKGARVCETCGSPVETTSSGDFGCMVCLFDAALDRDTEESEVAIASPLDQFGAYTIEHHADGSAWELGRGAMGVTYRAIGSCAKRAPLLRCATRMSQPCINSEFARKPVNFFTRWN